MRIGLVTFVFLVIFSTLGNIYPIDPHAPDFGIYQPPSSEHIFGTDALGRDVFAQTIHGAWYSLKIGLIAGVFCTMIGIFVGGIGGYFGKVVDEATNAFTNIILTIPTLALLIVIASYMKIRSEWLMILMISSVSWGWTARAIRAQVLSLKTREFVDIAKMEGFSRLRILFGEILPNMLAYIVMALAVQISASIIAEASLSSIGLGPTAVISLGIMLRWAITFQSASTGCWWWILPPGIIITLFSLSLLLIQEGLDEIFNPRTREQKHV